MNLLNVAQLNNLDNHSTIAIVGKRATGKTVLVDYIKSQRTEKPFYVVEIPEEYSESRRQILVSQSATTFAPDMRRNVTLSFLFAVTGTVETHQLHEIFCPSMELMEFRGLLNELNAYETLVVEYGRVIGKFKAPLLTCTDDAKDYRAVTVTDSGTFADDFDKCSIESSEAKLQEDYAKAKELYTEEDKPEPLKKFNELQNENDELEKLMTKIKDCGFPLSKDSQTKLEETVQNIKNIPAPPTREPVCVPKRGVQLGFDDCKEPELQNKTLKQRIRQKLHELDRRDEKFKEASMCPSEYQGQEYSSLTETEKVYQNSQNHFEPLEGLEPTSDKPDSHLHYEFKPMQPIEKKQSELLKKSGILLGGSDEWINAVLNPPNEKSDETETETETPVEINNNFAPYETPAEKAEENVWKFQNSINGGLQLRSEPHSLVIREHIVAGKPLLEINDVCISKHLLEYIDTISNVNSDSNKGFENCDDSRRTFQLGVVIKFRNQETTKEVTITETTVKQLSQALETVTKPKEVPKVEEETILPYNSTTGAALDYVLSNPIGDDHTELNDFLYGNNNSKVESTPLGSGFVNQKRVPPKVVLPPLRPKQANQGIPPPMTYDKIVEKRQDEVRNLKIANKGWMKFL